LLPRIGDSKLASLCYASKTKASDLRARFPRRELQRHTRERGAGAPCERNAPAPLGPAQTRGELTIASHPTLDFSICSNSLKRRKLEISEGPYSPAILSVRVHIAICRFTSLFIAFEKGRQFWNLLRLG